MKSYVTPIYDQKKTITGFYFKGKKYSISRIGHSSIFHGIASMEIMIGRQTTALFHDELFDRWYVFEKTRRNAKAAA